MFQLNSISGHRLNPFIIITINSQPFSSPITHFSYSFNKPIIPFRSSVSSLPSILAHKGSEVEFEKEVEEEEFAMTITPSIRISDRKLVIKDRTILTNVPDNVITTSGATSGPVEGVFIGAEFDQENSRHVVPLGKLRDVKFLSCFRFKLWWMAQKMGEKGSEIPLETQFLLVETKDGSHLGSDNNNNNDNNIVYAVFLPLIEGSFRAVLQGNPEDELELCLESGDKDTVGSAFNQAVYVHAGCDPFIVITEAIRAVKLHLKTFRQRHEKKLPGIVDYFGWCTWDAFYQEVTQEGVEAGLESLTAGGVPPKFVIIDDGWQSVGADVEVEKPLMRLTGLKENEKFQKNKDPTVGIKNIVNIAKEKYGLNYVYVWHAITGYWGGVRPGVKGMEEYGSVMKYPEITKGVMENEPGWKTDAIAVQGLGLVNPKSAYKFYNEMHSYLASAGVDGLKVDVQCILETLGSGLGGRVELTKQYHQALDASVSKNFPDNGCIACMSHSTDALYCSKQTAVVRASDDFYPRDPVSHTIHIACVAYNSVFLGEIMVPDWDMFHSLHPAAEYHGSARALSGGPVYVSDAPGKHNFDVLRKLVLRDGSILRARLPGRPTKDSLFSDPSRDGVSLLKIWNMNKYTGVLGVYNCQGAAWNSVERKNTFHETNSEAITGYVRGRDVHFISEAAVDPNWSGDCALYSNVSAELVVLPHNAVIPISLKVLEHETYTVTPIKVLAPGFSFAPLGLIDMYNAGGAIEGLKYEVKSGAELSELETGYQGEGNLVAEDRIENLSTEAVAVVSMEVKGCGRFGAYSSVKPRKCTVGRNMVDFAYDSDSGLLTLNLDDMPPADQKVHLIKVEV
ncbi:PREDICTED: probable galactinol--sucrose galactosyltransferase 6 [Nicotiana attenuata]|uniref:galactinol--sucrose galactosyltransferase n=1 Tax=Nicotiana attenuata TaxID=49451 RepID=A0A314KIZ5_NICAT|nr:PREDICTED: probable galactinol--sucrose galactosyltransferase 6 [Nicotiana attenuata]OIT29325.1 putative galactinol--sucrose galactosyltransferase 6 [Nicotiana attenuata]